MTNDDTLRTMIYCLAVFTLATLLLLQLARRDLAIVWGQMNRAEDENRMLHAILARLLPDRSDVP